MTYAPTDVSFEPYGNGSILGCFNEKDHGNFFEFSRNDEDFYTDYPHKVWVATPWHMDEGWRFARVLKTVAYVLTNDEDGYDVVEKWQIKQRRVYEVTP